MRMKPIVKVKVHKKVPASEIVSRIEKIWKKRFIRKKNTLYYKKKKIEAKWTVTTGKVVRLYQKIDIPLNKRGDKEFERKLRLNKEYMIRRTLVSADLMVHPKKLRRELYRLENILKKRYIKKHP